MEFGRAVATAFAVGSNRKFREGEVDQTEQIGWGYGFLGVAALIIVQLALIFWPSDGPRDAQLILDLSIAAFSALIVPFVLFALIAVITRRTARLPAAFLFLGLALAILQLVSALLASFGTGQSGFVIGVLFAVTFLAARGFFKLHWAPALLVGLIVVAGFIAAGFILLNLPSGRLLV